MNIFYLDQDPKTCAEYHADKHCVKMITEQAQLLCTAHRVLDGTKKQVLSKSGNRKIWRWTLPDSREDVLYASTHPNHPSAIWCRQSIRNYQWLHTMTVFLCKEYTHRYGKVHKVEASGLLNTLKTYPNRLDSTKGIPLTEPTPAMPPIYIVPGDSLKSYHNYYNGSKRHLHSWKNRSTPPFIVQTYA